MKAWACLMGFEGSTTMNGYVRLTTAGVLLLLISLAPGTTRSSIALLTQISEVRWRADLMTIPCPSQSASLLREPRSVAPKKVATAVAIR